MAINTEKYSYLLNQLNGKATLVAVSKTKPLEDLQALYDLGHRDFGENYVQELVDKAALLPKDIRWHFLGHLQSNKVKYIAPFVHLIHGVDSLSLLKEIDKQAAKNNRVIDCLLQIHIAKEETKFGFDPSELTALHEFTQWKNVNILGLMGMASFSDDKNLIKKEFANLKSLFDANKQSSYNEATANTVEIKDFQFTILSMGMSGDYEIALEQGSNLVRIGSLLFGERNYQH
jgi:pyridoxal phosphate enzyme (YggS family)